MKTITDSLPWRVAPESSSHGARLCIQTQDQVVVRTPYAAGYQTRLQQTVDLPHAEFIVLACNNHAALVDALSAMLSSTTSPGHPNTPTKWPAAHIVVEARAVLKRVQS